MSDSQGTKDRPNAERLILHRSKSPEGEAVPVSSQ